MIAALAALALATTPTCTPVKDADSLWASPATRWVFLGEMHGTNEMPDAFTNLVCLAAEKRGAITVVIEWPIETQPVLDAWLASDGRKQALAALLSAPEWHSKDQAGFTSAAYLRMFEYLRLLHKAGKVAGLRAFDKAAGGSDSRDRNIVMAERLRLIAHETNGLILILVGNVHASRTPLRMGPDDVVRPAAFLLPDIQRIAVGITSPGGTAWGCRREGCRIYNDGSGPTGPSSITWHREPDRRFDATYDLGKPVTASVPAIPVRLSD